MENCLFFRVSTNYLNCHKYKLKSMCDFPWHVQVYRMYIHIYTVLCIRVMYQYHEDSITTESLNEQTPYVIWLLFETIYECWTRLLGTVFWIQFKPILSRLNCFTKILEYICSCCFFKKSLKYLILNYKK